MAQDPVSVARISVKRDRLVLDVRLAPDAPRQTTAAMAAALVAAAPTLPQHACVNDRGTTLAAVLDATPLPHVLEHLIIDAQARAALPAVPDFVGVTTWVNVDVGIARVEVSYVDDLQALAAVKQALATLNGLLQG